MRLATLVPLFLSVFILSACGSSSSNSDTTVAQTDDSLVYSSIVSRKPFSSNDECPNGGITINQGIDSNKNGILDAEEIFESQNVCNGETGLNSLIHVETLWPGEWSECTYGGLKVSVGIDSNNNGFLDGDEITDASTVCSVIHGSTAGFSTLINMTDEAAGAHCAAGGQKITTGMDSNRNNILDSDEIVQIKYVCNGQPAVVYQTLIIIEEEPAGSYCSNGGQKISTGLDSNANGTLDSDEVDSTSYACNGENATESVNSLIRIDDEPAGSHCASGGKKSRVAWIPIMTANWMQLKSKKLIIFAMVKMAALIKV